jgi:hypothetical protein
MPVAEHPDGNGDVSQSRPPRDQDVGELGVLDGEPVLAADVATSRRNPLGEGSLVRAERSVASRRPPPEAMFLRPPRGCRASRWGGAASHRRPRTAGTPRRPADPAAPVRPRPAAPRSPACAPSRNALTTVAQSLFHDHVPAKKAGLPTAWINRRHDRPGWGATPAPPPGVARTGSYHPWRPSPTPPQPKRES